MTGHPFHSWPGEDERRDDLITEVPESVFHIGQCYGEKVAATVVCKRCGSANFFVGRGDYYTAIKCPTCAWEICIHEG